MLIQMRRARARDKELGIIKPKWIMSEKQRLIHNQKNALQMREARLRKRLLKM
jgi:hypothetical protein